MRGGPGGEERRGFTLIEVMAAMVVFSFGVLLVLRLVGALSTQMNTAALRTQVATAAHTHLDGLAALPYDSLPVGSNQDTLVLLGKSFRRTDIVLQTTPLVREIEVRVEPEDGEGPRFVTSTFVQRAW